ncbi:MAG: DinB family protein [Phycisphaeraceae bacterium]|nr:DinB family protein [Phycisphaerales bacterium]MCB9861287.1 DinB family protein [Phycisphaeraceae bacterium]
MGTEEKNLLSSSARDLAAFWWEQAWDDGLWAAGWNASIATLTPEQASWTPASGRKSIWQHVLHMCFWREEWLRRIDGQPTTPKHDLPAHIWPAITDVSQHAWDEARNRLAVTQEHIRNRFRSGNDDNEPLLWFLPHDAYHFGQINLLRAMQGLDAIE